MTAVLRIVSGSANPGLASAVANHLGVESDGCGLARYPDGELRPTVENVCGADVYVVQPTAPRSTSTSSNCSCCSMPAAARAPSG